MKRRILMFLIILLVAGFQTRWVFADLWQDLVPHFQVIRNQIEQTPLAWEDREPLHIALDTCQQQVHADRLEMFAVQFLMESFLAQYTYKVLPLLLSGEVGDEAIDRVVEQADYIESRLFFASGPLQVFDPLPAVTPPENSCNVQILSRSFNDYLTNPGGTLHARSADPLQFEARADPGPGTFEWTLEPEPEVADPPHFYTELSRVSFRPVDDFTMRLRVVYRVEGGGECEDVVWIKVHSRFLEPDN